jgi:hypothetical protein
MMKSLSRVGSVIGFALALGWAGSRVVAQDVNLYQIVRFEYFTQATTNRASTDAATFHNLDAFVEETYAGSVQSVTIKSPKGWSEAMVSNQDHFYLPQVPGETFDLSQSAPSGAYRFDVMGNSGEQQKSVSLPGPATGLAPVRIANFDDAQKVDATNDFVLEWEQVIDRTPHDFLLFHVTDSGGNKVFDSGEVPIGQTTLTIPGWNFATE